MLVGQVCLRCSDIMHFKRDASLVADVGDPRPNRVAEGKEEGGQRNRRGEQLR